MTAVGVTPDSLVNGKVTDAPDKRVAGGAVPPTRTKLRLEVEFEHGESPLTYITSPDNIGLLVAERTFERALQALPEALKNLRDASISSTRVMPAAGDDHADESLPTAPDAPPYVAPSEGRS